MKKSISSTQQSSEIVTYISENVFSQFKIKKGDLPELRCQMYPIISNALHAREKSILERERFQTFVALSRVLDDAAMESAINALGYKLVVEKSSK